MRNRFEGSVDGDRVVVAGLPLRAAIPPGANGMVDVVIRAERCNLRRIDPDSELPENCFVAGLVGELAFGNTHTLRLEPEGAGPAVEIEVAARPYEVLGIAGRQRWVVELPADDLHVMAPAPGRVGAIEGRADAAEVWRSVAPARPRNGQAPPQATSLRRDASGGPGVRGFEGRSLKDSEPTRPPFGFVGAPAPTPPPSEHGYALSGHTFRATICGAPPHRSEGWAGGRENAHRASLGAVRYRRQGARRPPVLSATEAREESPNSTGQGAG